MLIACKFKRPNAPVELPTKDGKTTTYFFRPIDPKVPESEHVADVTDPDHIARLLAIPEGYHVAQSEALLQAAEQGAQVAGKPKPRVSDAPPGQPEQSAGAGDQAQPEAAAQAGDAAPSGEGDSGAPGGTPQDAAEKNEEAMALLALSPREFKKAVGGQVDRAVLETALTIESGKGADERATYTKALKAALTG